MLTMKKTNTDDGRRSIRLRAGVSESWVARTAQVTRVVLQAWEAGDDSHPRAERLADVYAVLLWIPTGSWPVVKDKALREAVARVRSESK